MNFSFKLMIAKFVKSQIKNRDAININHLFTHKEINQMTRLFFKIQALFVVLKILKKK